MNTSTLFSVRLSLASFGFLAGCAPVAYHPSALHRQMVGLWDNFDHFDRDGDGCLCPGEFANGLHEEGILQLTHGGAERVFTAYDSNHDGRISLGEVKFAASFGPAMLGEDSQTVQYQ